jgi:hypothetical protein
MTSVGSVIVWTQSFEASRNRELAERQPEFAERLLNIGPCIFDRMLIFNQGLVRDADFHGSASIKKVILFS